MLHLENEFHEWWLVGSAVQDTAGLTGKKEMKEWRKEFGF